jgi:kynurenine 3-monooxygenase
MFQGKGGLDNLKAAPEIVDYFNKYFPDIVPLMPDLIEDFQNSPNSALVTVRTSPYHYNNKILLIGDAAHACVPFYGQGMNAAFEDCLILSELYDKYKGNPNEFIPQFSVVRNEAGLALAELSLENYIEMRHHTASNMFLLQKKLESIIHCCIPNYWIPQYSMIAFTRMPYHIAQQKAKQQEKILKISILSLTTLLLGTAAYNSFKYFHKHTKANL